MSKQLKLPTLLVVTDNPSTHFWVKKHFDDQFFILAAEKKLQALEALNTRLDFIVVDGEFEEMDALELCHELSKRSQKNLVPILLITGRLNKAYREKALSSGVTDFLSNQLDVEEFQTRIAEGEKAALSRQKTEEIGRNFKPPVLNASAASLKEKFVLNDQVLKLLASTKAEKTPLALLLLRIDGFNQMQAPDKLAELLSSFVRTFLRKSDLLLPPIEGSFMILLANTTNAQARAIAEMIQREIQHHRFENTDCTVSIAVSSLEASEKAFRNMIDSAIKSLKTQSSTNLIINLDQENS